MRLTKPALARVTKSIVFCLVLSALLWGVDWVLRPTAAGLLPWGALAETHSEVDAIMLGSSRTHASVLPMELWRTSGVTAVDVTCGGQNLSATLSYLEQALESQDPEVVMLEVSMMGSRRIRADLTTAHNNFDDMPRGAPRTMGILRSTPPTAWPELFFPLESYHSRWATLMRYDFMPDKRAKRPWDRGSLYLPQSTPMTGESTPTVIATANYQADLTWIREIARLCNRRGARLVLFAAPSLDPTYVADRPVLVRLESDLREELPNLIYLDLNHRTAEMGIEPATDYKDVAHLNHRGAVKLSKWLARYLTQEHGLPDHRTDELSSRWNQALVRYDREFVASW